MNIPSGALKPQFKEDERANYNNIPVPVVQGPEHTNTESVKKEQTNKVEKEKTKREQVEVITDRDYGVLDWVRVLLILTIPIVNVIAIIIWLAKRPMNRTAANYALGFIIYTCIMAIIAAIYYFFIM